MPGVIVAHPRLVEYRVDAKGNRIRQADGYAVTARYQAACCQFQSSLYDRGSLDQLPPQYLVSRRTRHSKTPRFHFGLGVTTLQLYDYAFKHKLVPEENRVHPGLTVVTLWATIKELVRVSGACLYLGAVIHPDYQWIVARFSNYTWRKERMQDAGEQRVTQYLQAELHTLDTPRWYEESDSD